MRAARTILLVRCSAFTIAAGLMLGLAAAGAHAQDAAPEADAPDGSDIVVTGTRAALREATAEKKAADNFVETLHANDVGKLPDQNVAEAVKRLPGLSVANDQGEGRYVVIRGIDPSLVNVALNGQTLPAPEPDARTVKLDDLPSAMIQSITVTKSLLASQDANAIGGEVNIRTKTAFDSKAPVFFDARGSVGWYDLNNKSPYEIDGTLGGRFGAGQQFGAVVSVNYSRRPIESENFQGSDDWTNADRNGRTVPAGGGLRDYNLTRTRLGIVGNFDWHPSDDVKLYIRSSYSKFEDHETRDQNLLAITKFTSDPLQTTGTVLVRHREEDDNTKSVTLGGEFDVGGGTLEMSGGWTRAEKVDPIRSEFAFTTAKGAVPASYDASTYPYSMLPTGAAAGVFDDPSQFVFSKVNFETRSAYEQLWQGRIDYTHPIGIGDGSEIKVGFKYLDRHKADNRDREDYKAGKTAWALGRVAYTADPNFYDGLFHFGERVDWYKARDYMAANSGVVKIDDAGTIADTLASDYDVREEIVAGYAMATLKFGALTVIPGLRVEHTRDRTAAKIVDAASTLADGYNVFGANSYTDVFPGLNVKFEAMPGLLLRGAVTTSIGRPNYSTLAPFVTVEEDDPNPPTLTLGNPNLKPYKSVNFDASVEYYPTPDSLFSAGFFHKEIDDPIYLLNSRQTNFTVGGTLYPVADVAQYVNADRETVSGIELNAQTQFTALPGVLSGFGLSANYTHVWGHATAPNIRAGDIPLGYQSHDLGNVSLFYEKYGFAARLAFNYRSAFPDVVDTTPEKDTYYDNLGQLDFHLSYQITPQVTVFGDAINLTDAPWRHYIGEKGNLLERERYGAQLRGGVQVHF